MNASRPSPTTAAVRCGRLSCLLAVVVAVVVALTLGLAALLVPARAAGAPTASDWDGRGDQVLSPEAALAVLDALPADSPAPSSWGEGGRERWFGPAWQDVDGDGCDTRNEILARDLADPDFSRRPGRQDLTQGRGAGTATCPDATVYAGTLHDPYTGASVDFQRGEDSSQAVQIDHVVPLSYAWAHGAWDWADRTRHLLANDPLNLVAVSGGANQSKSNCGPATCPSGSSERATWQPASPGGWWPPERSYRCPYAARFVSVLAAYDLGVPDADRAALAQTLRDCRNEGVGTPLTGRLASIARQPAVAGALVCGVVLLVGGLSLRRRQRRWNDAVRRRRRRRPTH